MFARFCGLGPGHKSTHHETEVFRDDIKEVFGLGHGKDGMGDAIPPSQPTRDEDLEDGSGLDELDGDSESNSENSENSEESDEYPRDHDENYLAIEEELGYVVLQGLVRSRSQKASEIKDRRPGPQKTAKNQSKPVVTGSVVNTLK